MQPGEGQYLGRGRVGGELRERPFGDRGDHSGREPRGQPAPPEARQGVRAGRGGHGAGQAQPVGAFLGGAVLEQLECGFPPAQGGQTRADLPQLPRDDVLQRVLLVEDPAHVRGRQVEGAQRADEVEPVECLGAVAPVAAGAAGGFGQQAAIRVEADGLDGDARVLRKPPIVNMPSEDTA